MSRRLATTFLCVGLLLISTQSRADALRFESPRERVAVLELFTSQGCSSCPPADAWLSQWQDHPGLWREVIPMAFHVDYWDDLGWSDRFASPAFSQRQRDYRKAGLSGSVYTPGFMLQGREWRGWFRGQTPDTGPRQTVGRLSLVVESGNKVLARFEPEGEAVDAQLTAHLALLGFDLASEIGRGENAGRTLREDFVVLGVSSAASTSAAQKVWTLPWPQTRDAMPERQALVVWLSRTDSPAPQQAAGGWLASNREKTP